MPSENLNVALLQSDLIWENPVKNRQLFSQKITDLDSNTDIAILPEMFTTGFTMQPQKVAETMEGKTIQWLKQLAASTQIAICGSLVITENTNFYNRFVFVKPNGTILHYDKYHLFTLAGEPNVYSAGAEKLILDYKGWKICPFVCYDLRFPVLARNTENYDVLIYVANWPKQRITAWDTLLKARAIENMSYCIGVNRVGNDSDNNDYIGHSAVYDCIGESLNNKTFENETIITATLSKTNLYNMRKRFNFLNDRDNFTLLPK